MPCVATWGLVSQEARGDVASVKIVITDELPPSVPCICDVQPGSVRMLVRGGLDQRQTVQAFGDVLEKMIEMFPAPPPATV